MVSVGQNWDIPSQNEVGSNAFLGLNVNVNCNRIWDPGNSLVCGIPLARPWSVAGFLSCLIL